MGYAVAFEFHIIILLGSHYIKKFTCLYEIQIQLSIPYFYKSANSKAFLIWPQTLFGVLSSCISLKWFSCSLKCTWNILVSQLCSHLHLHLECLFYFSFSIQWSTTSQFPISNLSSWEINLQNVYVILTWCLVNRSIIFINILTLLVKMLTSLELLS